MALTASISYLELCGYVKILFKPWRDFEYSKMD